MRETACVPDSLRRHALRFGIAGVGVALFAGSTYVIAAQWLAMPPMLANLESYLAGVLLGFRLHGRYTFGDRDRTASNSAAARYLLGSITALLLNSLWVWLLTGVLRAPAWLPVIPMVTATPAINFVINRRWVFPVARA
jgi:putative flippase GtrA